MLRPGCFHGNQAGNSSRWRQHGTGRGRSSRSPLNTRRHWVQTLLLWSVRADILTLQLTYTNTLATRGTGAWCWSTLSLLCVHGGIRGPQCMVLRKMAAQWAPDWALCLRPSLGGSGHLSGSLVHVTRVGKGAHAAHLGQHFFSLVMDKRPGRFGVICSVCLLVCFLNLVGMYLYIGVVFCFVEDLLLFLFYLWGARNVNSGLRWRCWRTSGRCEWIYECEHLKP